MLVQLVVRDDDCWEGFLDEKEYDLSNPDDVKELCQDFALGKVTHDFVEIALQDDKFNFIPISWFKGNYETLLK